MLNNDKMNQEMTDVLIIGAGPGGIFAAYELVKENPDLKVTVIEKGIFINFQKAFILVSRPSHHCILSD